MAMKPPPGGNMLQSDSSAFLYGRALRTALLLQGPDCMLGHRDIFFSAFGGNLLVCWAISVMSSLCQDGGLKTAVQWILN